MAFTPQQHREHRARLRERGICTICHKAPAREERTTCQPCVRRINVRHRAKRKLKLTCRDCSKPRLDLLNRCRSHHLRHLLRRRQKTLNWLREGRCTRCGGPTTTSRHCPGCRESLRQYRRFGSHSLGKQVSVVTTR